MAKIKIEDLTKGIQITEEELRQIRGGWSPQMPKPTGRKRPLAGGGNPEGDQSISEKPDVQE